MNRFFWGLLIGAPIGMIAADRRRTGQSVRDVAAAWTDIARKSYVASGTEQALQAAKDSAAKLRAVSTPRAFEPVPSPNIRSDEPSRKKSNEPSTTTTASATFPRHESISPTERQAGTTLSQVAPLLNSVTREELISIYGIGPVIADRILHSRPYHRDEDIVDRGVLPRSAWVALEHQLRKRTA